MREDSFKGVLTMKDNKMQNETMRLAYESPCVEVLLCGEDVVRTSSDAGEQYPEGWN